MKELLNEIEIKDTPVGHLKDLVVNGFTIGRYNLHKDDFIPVMPTFSVRHLLLITTALYDLQTQYLISQSK